MFANLSDRLASTFKGLRGKGRLSEADVDATVREIRTALLDADVSVTVVQAFTKVVHEVSQRIDGQLGVIKAGRLG